MRWPSVLAHTGSPIHVLTYLSPSSQPGLLLYREEVCMHTPWSRTLVVHRQHALVGLLLSRVQGGHIQKVLSNWFLCSSGRQSQTSESPLLPATASRIDCQPVGLHLTPSQPSPVPLRGLCFPSRSVQLGGATLLKQQEPCS